MMRVENSKIHKFFFICLVIFTIIDPSNTLFRIKEFLFLLTFISGFSNQGNTLSKNIIVGIIMYFFVFAVLWLIIGYISNYNFSSSFALSNIKALSFFSLILVCLDSKIDYPKIFSKSTLLIIFMVLIIYFLYKKGGVNLLNMVFRDISDTAKLSSRTFGSLKFEVSIFYKTSPLLLFGLAYLCHENRFRYRFTNMLVIALCVIILFYSGTRANIVSTFLILFFYCYFNYIRKSKNKIIIYLFIFIAIIFIIIPFVWNSFLDKNEVSNEIKVNLILDYIKFWKSHPQALVLGQGIGGGIETSIRGISYNNEITYLEILRIYGLVGSFLFLIYLVTPIMLFIKARKSLSFYTYMYILVAYVIYILIEIPTNPLLLSSTGMIVLVVVYSTSIRVYRADKKELI